MKQDPVRVGTIRADNLPQDNTGLVVLSQVASLTPQAPAVNIMVPVGSQILHLLCDVPIPFDGGGFISIGVTPGGNEYTQPIPSSFIGRVDIPFTPTNLYNMSSVPPDAPGGLSGTIYTQVGGANTVGYSMITVMYTQKNNVEKPSPLKFNALALPPPIVAPVSVPVPSPIFSPSVPPVSATPTPAPTPSPTPGPGPTPAPTPTTPTPAPTPSPTPTPSPGPTPTPAPTPSPVGIGPYGQSASRYTAMTFQDEFEAGIVDPAKWILQDWYMPVNTKNNYTVEGGSLKIWAEQPYEKENRTINTDGKFEQLYGYFECEAKLNIGNAVWPAFWLYAHPTNDRPEIDIMEAYSGGGPSSGWSDGSLHPNNYGITLHKANADYSYHEVPYAYKLTDFLPAVDLSAGFHKYAVHWDANEIRFYFDGAQIGPTYLNDGYFSKPMYVLLDVWLGSASGDPTAAPVLTGKGNSFEIMYVRVWGIASSSPVPSPTTSPVPTPTAPTPAPAPSGAARPFLLDSGGNLVNTTSLYGNIAFRDEFDSVLNTSVWDLNHMNNYTMVNYDTTSYTDTSVSPPVVRTVARLWPLVDSSLPNTNITPNQFFRREMSTPGSFNMLHGYVEWNGKLLKGKGIFPAFWLFNDGPNYPNDEIDMMEAYGNGDGLYTDSSYNVTDFTTTVWQPGGGGPTNRLDYVKGKDTNLGLQRWGDAFHIWGMHWDSNTLIFYMDGREYHRTSCNYNNPMYLLFQLWFGNGPLSTSGIPDTNNTPQGQGNSFELDWVRVWTLL